MLLSTINELNSLDTEMPNLKSSEIDKLDSEAILHLFEEQGEGALPSFPPGDGHAETG